MSHVKLNLIAAACNNMGIGVNGNLPWRLKKEMAYFSSMTTRVSEPSKRNAVIMGRVTWDCIPDKYRPLADRVNIVLTHHVEKVKENVPDGVIVVKSIDDAIDYIEGRQDIESTWVIGGSSIYKAAMEHKNCGKIFLTEIQKKFACDTFFPPINNKFQLTTQDGVPQELQTEGDAAMEHKNCGKIFLTEIQKKFACDTFFPPINNKFQLTTQDGVPQELQTEGDISYYFRIYQKS